MNNWHTEFMAEFDRQHILEQAEEIRLESFAAHSRLHRPGLFGRTMFHFANWMIAAGSQLRRRYEVPAVPCSSSPTRTYVP